MIATDYLENRDPDLLAASIFKRVRMSLARTTITLEEYFKQACPLILPNRELIPSWHIGLILEYLTAVDMGQLLRLLINIPPRSLKSSLVSVAWPTWSWTEKPWMKWVFTSYAGTLSEKHSLDRRRVIESPWYQQRWGDTTRIQVDQNKKSEFESTQGGVMIATSVGGSITGKGGDRIVIDDIVNPEQAESDAERVAAIRYYQQTLSTRLDNKKTGAIVVVEQRTHLLDLTGTVLKEGGWTHLCIPAESPARSVVKFPLSGREIVRDEGSVICEEREDKATLARLKLTMGPRAYAAQEQQNPYAEASGFFPDANWRYFSILPVDDFIWYWVWDTAAEDGQENDYTVGGLMGHGAHGTYLKRVRRGRWKYPEARRLIEEEYRAFPSSGVIIEDSSNGKAIGQDMQRNSNIPVIMVAVSKDKKVRAALASPVQNAGLVHLPEGEPWVAEFKEELSQFPQVDHDDQTDMFTLGVNYFYQGASRPISAMAGQNIPLSLQRPSWL